MQELEHRGHVATGLLCTCSDGSFNCHCLHQVECVDFVIGFSRAEFPVFGLRAFNIKSLYPYFRSLCSWLFDPVLTMTTVGFPETGVPSAVFQ